MSRPINIAPNAAAMAYYSPGYVTGPENRVAMPVLSQSAMSYTTAASSEWEETRVVAVQSVPDVLDPDTLTMYQRFPMPNTLPKRSRSKSRPPSLNLENISESTQMNSGDWVEDDICGRIANEEKCYMCAKLLDKEDFKFISYYSTIKWACSKCNPEQGKHSTPDIYLPVSVPAKLVTVTSPISFISGSLDRNACQFSKFGRSSVSTINKPKESPILDKNIFKRTPWHRRIVPALSATVNFFWKYRRVALLFILLSCILTFLGLYLHCKMV